MMKMDVFDNIKKVLYSAVMEITFAQNLGLCYYRYIYKVEFIFQGSREILEMWVFQESLDAWEGLDHKAHLVPSDLVDLRVIE